MKKIILVLLTAVTVSGISPFCTAQERWNNLMTESAKVFEEMTHMPEEGIPASLVRQCHAIAIFPNTLGGGFIIGGKYGQGVVLTKDPERGTWSAPALYSIFGGSFGWQIGGQATDIILLIMNERGVDGLIRSNFKLGGDASIAAGPIGRDAAAGFDLQLKGGILSYSRTRGLFAGVKLEGAYLNFLTQANRTVYGRPVTAASLLLDRSVAPSAGSERLLQSLAEFYQ